MLGWAKGRRQDGDTIIEVMFAVVIFSMVAVGAMSIMNNGTAIAQRSLELTLVRQQIDAQAEALRFVHHSYVAAYGTDAVTSHPAAEWKRLLDSGLTKSSASPFGDGGCTTPPSGAFVMNARTGRLHTGAITPMNSATSRPFSQVVYQGDPDTGALTSSIDSVHGLWIEAVRSGASSGTGYIDFHIRACWYSPASNAPSTIGTIVRLYEPRTEG